MGDTISIKNPQNNLINQHTRASRYDSTAEFRIIEKTFEQLCGYDQNGTICTNRYVRDDATARRSFAQKDALRMTYWEVTAGVKLKKLFLPHFFHLLHTIL